MLLEDEDGAPFPDEVQLAFAAQAADLIERGRRELAAEVAALWRGWNGWLPGAARGELSQVIGVELPSRRGD